MSWSTIDRYCLGPISFDRRFNEATELSSSSVPVYNSNVIYCANVARPESFCAEIKKGEFGDDCNDSERPVNVLSAPMGGLSAPMGGFSHMEGFSQSSSPGSEIMDFAKGTTTLGFVFQGGVIVACDSRASMGSYISSQTVRKVVHLSDYLLGTIAGGAADCQFWERWLSEQLMLLEQDLKSKVTCLAAAKILANLMFRYRRYDLSCGTMVAGWDEEKDEGSLYMVDNKGTLVKHNIFSVGSGSTYAYGVLDAEYNYDMSLESAADLATRSIYHATHRDGASGGVARVYHVTKGKWTIIHDAQDVSELHWKYQNEKRGR